MHLKPDSRPGDSPVAGAQGAVSLSDLSHLIAAGVYDSELRLIAEQAQMLTLASGAAIALRQDQLLVCRARAGSTAPALGARLDTQSGLSGECVRTARTLVCQDTESDGRVNLDVCRYLGIRSIAVLPICLGLDIVGVFEVFSSHPGTFTANEVAALESMRDLVISVIRPGPQAESPAFSALSARAAQEEAPVLHAVATSDPEDDLLCEIEQRAQPAPPPARSASPPFPPSPAKQPPVLLSPSTPPPPPKTIAPAPPPPDPMARAVELLKSGSPAVPGPRPVPPFANPDPEDDLLCEIALR
ncbi:MAG TPA: GAF domain-containing protein, partial [Terriglobales bacterium]|nr:GAF domain-containing protein [Terriglobales bacterium]